MEEDFQCCHHCLLDCSGDGCYRRLRSVEAVARGIFGAVARRDVDFEDWDRSAPRAPVVGDVVVAAVEVDMVMAHLGCGFVLDVGRMEGSRTGVERCCRWNCCCEYHYCYYCRVPSPESVVAVIAVGSAVG